MTLHERWLKSHEKNINNAETIWAWIEAAHSEGHRYYHTLTHLEQCFNELDRVADSISTEDFQLIELAIWFHDIVYQPREINNEEQSIKLFRNASGVLGLSTNLVDQVSELIIATKHTDPDPKRSEACKLFLDIDLSILGQEKKIYEQYAANVRKEYEWVPLDIYLKKRTEILQRIKDWSPIYQTEVMRKKYEMQAKTNLSRAIAILTYKGVDPVC